LDLSEPVKGYLVKKLLTKRTDTRRRWILMLSITKAKCCQLSFQIPL